MKKIVREVPLNTPLDVETRQKLKGKYEREVEREKTK